ncbi:MAG: phospho-sugar mutase [Candidatus Nanopelagicales bacterium]
MSRVREDWIADDPDERTRTQLRALMDAADSGDRAAQAELDDAFRGPLAFGTAGLRGRMGPGPHRINRVTVSQTAAGLAAYLLLHHHRPSVVIGYDARHDSDTFARDIAEVMGATGVHALILPRALPTPVLAYAVRALRADAGVMVTASHNPAMDNGIKVYLGDGRQIIPPADVEIAALIDAVGAVRDLPRSDAYRTLDDEIVEAYVDQAARVPLRDTPRDVISLHTAMHGVGAHILRDAALRAGFPAPLSVPEQEEPDPDFPTVAFPNPEEPGALDLAMAQACRITLDHVIVDVIIATDPDADRCALVAAVPDGHAGGWVALTGDEVGWLLGWWLLRRGGFGGGMAASLVSSTMLARIAEDAGVPFTVTLTGFKWISRVPDLGYGYEEALGYCVDPQYVTDKDGITASLLALELVAALKVDGRTVLDVLDELALRHGVHATRQVSLRVADPRIISHAIDTVLRVPPEEIAGLPVIEVHDLAAGYAGLSPTEGVLLHLAGARVIVRPSGTEPKVKCYLEVVHPVDGAGLSSARQHAQAILDRLAEGMRTRLEPTPSGS